MEQVLDVRADAFEIVLCGSRQVRTTLDSVSFHTESNVAEIGRKHVGAALNEVPRPDMYCEARLRFCGSFPYVLRIREPQISLKYMRSAVTYRASQQSTF